MPRAAKYIGTWIPKDLAYYMHLDQHRVIQSLMYRYKGSALIYGISCHLHGKIYIGSTLSPSLRFHKHLISGEESNVALQAAIAKYGLENFTVHIFELVNLDPELTYSQKQATLRKIEQQYIDRIPAKRLYNTVRASGQS